jgi:hypothetical protein
MTNWGWFMQWMRKKIVGHDKITVISEYIKKLIILDRHPINSSENQKSCKKISQRNKCPT